ncbi:MAG TPA: hypothetical protein VKZ63_11050, partial [Kofleriaceae bacterium]|nr:hypothetical protein [Kofleriaceae bacterium]
MAKKKPTYGWGGARPGAGRPRTVKGRVPHRPRQTFARRTVVLVSVKTVPAVGKLRRKRLLPVLHDAIAEGAVREGFRICQFSIQQDHIHLLVEADDSDALARG